MASTVTASLPGKQHLDSPSIRMISPCEATARETTTARVRRPISAKIFGIALLLLLLMVSVTYVSTSKLSQLNGQLALLSNSYVVLDQAMAEARAYGVGQLLMFERMLHDSAGPNLDAMREEGKKLFETTGGCQRAKLRDVAQTARQKFSGATQDGVIYELARLCADYQVTEAKRVVESALRDASRRRDVEQVERFTNLRTELKDVVLARDELHATVTKYLVEYRKEHQWSIAFLQGELDRHRSNVGKEIGDVTDLLHNNTRGAARHAAELEHAALWFSWVVTAIATVLGLGLAAALTRSLVRPVRQLLSGAKAIERGNMDIHIEVQSADEMASLARSFNHMAAGLRERETIRETFGKYVDPRIVKGLLDSNGVSIAGEKKQMTVFFSDIRGFSAICEQLTPAGVVRLLNHYLSVMSAPISEHHGVIDKYIGDAIMAFWGPPFTTEDDHPVLACDAALKQAAGLGELQRMLPDVLGLRKGLPALDFRTGIATGDVTAGSIGCEATKSYTVIGDTVNQAARLQAVNKAYGTRIIIAEATWRMVADGFEARELDFIRVPGKTEPIRAFELLGRKGQIDSRTSELRDAFGHALHYYHRHDWTAAYGAFSHCLSVRPDDGPSKIFVSRSQHFEKDSPGPDWDGVWTVTTK
jgi:class 3 adenylate cyclase